MSNTHSLIVKNLYKLEIYRSIATPEQSPFVLLAEELKVDVQSVRNAASKYGFVGFRTAFTPRQEEMLVCACLIFAGKGTPLTIPMFSEVARKLAVNKKKKTFFTSFHERLEKELTVDDGKITSPT